MLGKRVCANSAQRWISWLSDGWVDDGGSNPPLSRSTHSVRACVLQGFVLIEDYFLWR